MSELHSRLTALIIVSRLSLFIASGLHIQICVDANVDCILSSPVHSVTDSYLKFVQTKVAIKVLAN